MTSWDPRLDGLIRVEAFWLVFGRRSYNVWWLKTEPPVTRGQLHDAAEAVAAWDTIEYAAFRSEDSQLYGVRANDRSQSPIAMYLRQGIHQLGVVRNAINPMLPAPQAGVAEWLKGSDRRRPHRSYLVGLTTLMWGFPLPDSETDLTVFNELAADGVDLALSQLISLFNLVGGCTMVLPTVSAGVTTVKPVTGAHLDRHYTGTRVRRGPGRQRVGM